MTGIRCVSSCVLEERISLSQDSSHNIILLHSLVQFQFLHQTQMLGYCLCFKCRKYLSERTTVAKKKVDV